MIKFKDNIPQYVQHFLFSLVDFHPELLSSTEQFRPGTDPMFKALCRMFQHLIEVEPQCGIPSAGHYVLSEEQAKMVRGTGWWPPFSANAVNAPAPSPYIPTSSPRAEPVYSGARSTTFPMPDWNDLSDDVRDSIYKESGTDIENVINTYEATQRQINGVRA